MNLNPFNENKIDDPTSKALSSNQNIGRSSDDLSELNGDSFYGDLSNLYKLPENQFIKKLAEECKKMDTYSNKVIYVPIVSQTITPIPYNLINFIKKNPERFKSLFEGVSFVFINNQTRENFAVVADKYEPNQVNTITGLFDRITSNMEVKAVTGSAERKSPEKQVIDKGKAKKERVDKNKKELVKAVAKAVDDKVSDSDDSEMSNQDIMNAIDKDEDIIAILSQIETDEKPAINKTRAARMSKLNKEFLDSTVGKQTVRSLIFNTEGQALVPAHLKVSTINKDEWDNLRFNSFEKVYDLNRDIVSMLYSLGDENKQYPVAIRKISTEDTSTSMDYLITYKVECEDSFGKRFTLKFDIPKFINNRFMMLRGNEKAMSGQLMLLPCLKTDQDTVQLVSNYNKIFIRRYGMANKSYPITDRLLKSLNKYKGSKLKIIVGDNTLICTKYDLPVDYIDLAANFSTIETKDRIYYFDQDVYYSKFKADPNKGIPYCVNKATSEVCYYAEDSDNIISYIIADELLIADDEFAEIFNNTKAAERLSYSQASILSNKIPLIVLLGYHCGLENILKRSKISYKFENSRPESDKASIRFKDTKLIYKVTYESNMLLNGLSECDTENYTVAEMDKRVTWLDFLDNFGGRILSDGLDNFKDLFMDPITVEVCKDCKLPIDYIDLLIYANNLLADNKYNRHTDISGNRYRTNEIVAAYFYIALAKSYEQYANAIRRGNKGPMTMKQTAVIDQILTSNISSDLSTLNPLLELTTASTATFKGPSGMNSDRAYGLDKRTYDESMINKLALSTGFSANVGIDRQTTIDMDIDGTRGYIKNTNEDDMSITKTFSMSEAVTPFGVTRDDPFRSAMTYIQTSKHSMRTKKSSPLLITNGADEAMPYLNSSTYAVKAQADGTVEEITDNYMIIKYKNPIPSDTHISDEKPSAYRMINLKETVKKNSDGGFFITIKLDTNLKKGSKFKSGDILAYDKASFGVAHEDDELAYNLGVLTKVAIMNTDEGFEDSTSISHALSEALASEVVTMRDTPPLTKTTNIYNIVKVGDPIQEGDPLIIYQNAFDEEDANLLLKSITDEDIVSDLGRVRIKSKYTGVVQDIKIYRTCEIEEMSSTMQKIVRDYEKGIKATRAMYKKYGIPGANMLDPDYVMPQTGKLKNCPDGIVIEFYIKYNDKMSVGDKLVAQSANKGTIKDIFPEGMEPFSENRPDEKIDALFAARSFNARMVTSVFTSGAINKCLIELDRAVKDIMGLEQIPLEEVNEH